jgi:putative endonuclease
MPGLLSRIWTREAPGHSGESLACRHLQAKGFEIVLRNFRCRSGEVDVVARDGAFTVFVEVKERHGQSHGEGFEAVTFGKRRRLIRAARIYAATRGLSDTPLRFDVVSIDWMEDAETPRIRHDEHAFDSDGA